MRAALEVLAAVAPSWLAAAIPDGWYDRYGQRGDDWRLPKSEKARADLAVAVGRDGYLLLDALNTVDCPAWLGQIEAIQILRLTWIQQYYRDQTSIRLRDKDLGQPPGARLILSPYDIDARYAAKRGRIWRGYKGHFTETCEPDAPHVIVHVTTTPASTGDIETVKDRYADLAAADLLPSEHFVDTGYVSVDVMLAARDDYGIDLIGPLPPDTSWQAKNPQAFDLTRFDIDWEAQKVLCPNGKVSRNWQNGSSRDGLPVIQVTFRRPDCEPCPDRPLCTRSAHFARHLTFRPQRQVETQRKQRGDQETDAWRDRYKVRSGAESLMAQASRRSDVHQARYRGLAKTFLQHVLTAIAINLIRVSAWLNDETTTGSWTSRLTRLRQNLAPA